MADLNALIAQGYQVQTPPDPFAQYSKMQQLENSATQNRLAQQQMQENAQFAPLRMQEMQAKAGTAQLTFDEAKQAKDVVDGLMAKSAENGGPTDPIETIKFLISHPNSRVQQMGKTMADSYKLLQEFEQQQRYAQRAPSPTGFAAPAAAPTAAYMPTSAQGTLGGPTSAMPGALGSGTFDVNAPAVAPVANALAQTVPSVNAFRPGTVTAESIAEQIRQGNKDFGNAPGWAKDRELLMKQYEALLNPRARIFAPIDASKYTPESIRAFNLSGDQSDLVSITPKNNVFSTLSPKDYTQESIRAFNVSGDYADLVPKEKSDKTVGNINAADFTPASVQAFSASGNYSDLVPKPTPDKKVGNINAADFTPASVQAFNASGNYADLVFRTKPSAKNEFEQLLDASNMTEDQKAEARRAKIAKETARPEQKAEAKSEFEKLLDASDMTEEQKAAARRAKITKEIAGPADRPESRSEFEKLLDASNMTEEQKAAARNAKIAKETASLADRPEARSEFEKLLDASNMTEDQKAAARRAKITKEIRISPTGEGDGMPKGSVTVLDPSDPTGKKVIVVTTARAIKEGLTPFTSVSKEEKVPQAYRDRADKLQNVSDAVNNYATVLKDYKAGDIINPMRRGQFANAHATALLQAKELFNLGVLNGGDEKILNKVLASPVDFSAVIVPIATIKQQAADLQGVIDRANQNLAKTYGQPVIPLNPANTPRSNTLDAADAILNKGKK